MQRKHTHCTEVRFTSLFSGGFTIMVVIIHRKRNWQNALLCTVLHIVLQVLFRAGNKDNCQNVDLSLLPKKLWLSFMGMKQRLLFITKGGILYSGISYANRNRYSFQNFPPFFGITWLAKRKPLFYLCLSTVSNWHNWLGVESQVEAEKCFVVWNAECWKIAKTIHWFLVRLWCLWALLKLKFSDSL